MSEPSKQKTTLHYRHAIQASEVLDTHDLAFIRLRLSTEDKLGLPHDPVMVKIIAEADAKKAS